MNPRAQAGLEYLMTYGWALILIATIVGALVFMVSGPADRVVFSSSDPTKFLMKGGRASGGTAEIKLQNITGGGLEITSITMPSQYQGCTLNNENIPLTSNVSVKAGGELYIQCDSATTDSASIPIAYKDYAGLQKTVTIKVVGGETYCGDEVCNGSETCVTCPGDCPETPCCGNGTCETGETCEADVGSCPVPAACKQRTCANGCSTENIVAGQQDPGKCDSTTGCATPPCQCNGTGSCIPTGTCQADCTLTTDSICHSSCAGINGCTTSSVLLACNGLASGAKVCTSTYSYAICCTGIPQTCSGPTGTRCSEGECITCSTACDNSCQSAACYTIDPDCDSSGNPTRVCCGDHECQGSETYLSSSCPKDCCEADCTAKYDSVCHQDCLGWPGLPAGSCAIAGVCNSKSPGDRVCTQWNQWVQCCGGSTPTTCGMTQYCENGYCIDTVCGDSVCHMPESSYTCPADCGEPPI